MKKILIFSLAYFPRYVGGAEVAIKEITNRISDIEFHIVTHNFDAGDSREERIGNITVHRIGSGTSYGAKALFIPRAALAAWRLHQKETFDGAWAMMSYMTLPLVILRFCGVRIPYALSLQEGDPFEHVFKRPHMVLLSPLISRGFRHANVIQPLSRYLATWAEHMKYEGPIEVIPNGAAVRHFSREYTPAAINEIKDRLAKKMGDVFLITTSRLVQKNAVDDVIRALTKLPENVHFVVLGSGPDEAALRLLATELKVESRVQFMGYVDHHDMPKYLNACDIFIRPSRSEGMGASFIEAMAAGLPVIATHEGGIVDFLFDEKRNPQLPVTGFAVDKDSLDQIAHAVRNIMSNPEKVRAIVATAKRMVVDKYDWDMIARDMRERVFTRIVG